jgi:hypothetical protein
MQYKTAKRDPKLFNKICEIACILVSMRSAALAIVIAFIAVSTGFAQNPTRECETTVNFSGPAGVVTPGEPFHFTVELTGHVPNDVQYIWTVSGGTITDGQGTPMLTVVITGEEFIRASLEIKGLAAGCPNQFSENVPYCKPLAAILVDERSTPVTEIDAFSLETLISRLAQAPSNQGYLIEYFPPNTSRKTIEAKLQLIEQYLKNTFDPSRITIVTATAEEPFTKYYVIPPGAETPAI